MPHETQTDKTEIEIEKVPQAEVNEREDGMPDYKAQKDLTEEQEKRLGEEIFKGYDRLKTQRKEYDTKWDQYEAQYKGEMADDTGLEFNLNVPVTQVKIDAVVRLSLKAFLESDPKFSITARPVTAKLDKWDVIIDRQSSYLDYKLDEEIDIESPLRKVLHQAALYDVGIMKLSYEYCRKLKRREEKFSGQPETDDQGNITNPGLEAFVREYPDSVKPGNDGHWAFKDLAEFKDVVFKSQFMDLVYDDPNPTFVDCRDFFVDKKTEGYKGLCEAQLIIERQEYSWWELKKAEKNEDFKNVDKVKNIINDEGEVKVPEDGDDYKTWDYDVIECRYHFNMKDSEDIDDEEHLLCWFDVKSKVFLGAIAYPYDDVECDYLPFYIKNKVSGFYKGGMAEDLTDSHFAQNAILNFMLTETWMQLKTTPIMRKGSPIADQFFQGWKPGTPLYTSEHSLDVRAELDFLPVPQKAVAQQMMPILMFLGKYDDDRTGVSSLATGKESPTDPTAPAAKTAMLLQQSGINISDYINCLLPSFNLIGSLILQLTYQMSREGRPFRNKKVAMKVAGGDPFENISRDEMSAKTNIQSRAAGFAFDKINEKRENLALFQLLRGDPVVTQNPQAVYSLAKTLVASWSPLWKNKIDSILPDPASFEQQQVEIAIKALVTMVQQGKEQEKLTGKPLEPQFQEFVSIATKMASEAMTPTEEKDA